MGKGRLELLKGLEEGPADVWMGRGRKVRRVDGRKGKKEKRTEERREGHRGLVGRGGVRVELQKEGDMEEEIGGPDWMDRRRDGLMGRINEREKGGWRKR